jgi:hypothetical protein
MITEEWMTKAEFVTKLLEFVLACVKAEAKVLAGVGGAQEVDSNVIFESKLRLINASAQMGVAREQLVKMVIKIEQGLNLSNMASEMLKKPN